VSGTARKINELEITNGHRRAVGRDAEPHDHAAEEDGSPDGEEQLQRHLGHQSRF